MFRGWSLRFFITRIIKLLSQQHLVQQQYEVQEVAFVYEVENYHMQSMGGVTSKNLGRLQIL